MVKFANSCRQEFNALMSELVTQLGPDTRGLMLRIGLHSGPVTAGVLRGKNSRFQLFGDTVNTASRMESNGIPNKIHISFETAKLLIDAGKGHWVQERDTLVQAKGKGTIRTYWAEPTTRGPRSVEIASGQDETEKAEDKTDLIDWAADVLISLTKQAASHHNAYKATEQVPKTRAEQPAATAIDEFVEIIEVPRFLRTSTSLLKEPVDLSDTVTRQVIGFVRAISKTYRGKFLYLRSSNFHKVRR
jgi:Adenylate and Guanylate cyclase catalytic domain